MRLVVAWALGNAEDAEEILAGAGALQWALELGELRGEADKTAATIKMVLFRALAFMTDRKLMASVLPDGDEPRFDIAAYLDVASSIALSSARAGGAERLEVDAQVCPTRDGSPRNGALDGDEAALYGDLVADRLGRSVRLEQERIRFGLVERTILDGGLT